MINTIWTANHTKLRDRLAQLYLDKESALRIVEEAGLNPAFVTLSDTPINNWHEVIKKADAQGLLVQLIEAARVPYPNDETLKQALDLFKGRVAASSAAPPPRPISDVQLRDFINQYFEKSDIADVLLNLTDKLQQDGKIESSTTIDIGTFSDQSSPRSTIAREMVGFFRRRTWTPYLIAALKDANPDAFREKFGE
jgi:hypothetical protein